MLKMKYKELMSFPFQMVMQKLSAAPTDGKTAYRINLVARAIKDIRVKISAEYKAELMEPFAKRDTEGKFNEKDFTVDDAKKDAFEKAQDAFEEREAELDCKTLTPHDIRDIKITPDELGALSGILDMAGFDGPDAPGVPSPTAGGKKLRHA
jgi:hypothetical protein